MSRLPNALMNLAIWLLPPNRRAWGEAMRGEFDLIGFRNSEFALGCLSASLLENIMTIIGLARIVFVGLQVAAAALLGTWFWLFAGMLDNQDAFNGVYIVFNLQWLLLALIPIAVGLSAFKAMRDPTNRFHIADLGTAMVTNITLVFGMVWTVQFLGVLFLIPSTPPDTAGVTTSLVMGVTFGLFLLAIGILGRKGAASLRKAAWAALGIFILGHVVVFFAFPDAKAEYNLLQATILGIPVVLLAIAGTLFTWMQRPANPTFQA